MSQTIRRILVTGVGVLILAVLFLYYYEFPKTIQLDYPAIQYVEGDESSVQYTTVVIDGTMKRPLFRDMKFEGRIVIEGYDYTKSYELMDVRFHRSVRNGLGSLVYHTVDEGGSPVLHSLGFMWETGDFDQIKIMAHRSNDQGRITEITDTIIAPANNYETAVSIEGLFKD